VSASIKAFHALRDKVPRNRSLASRADERGDATHSPTATYSVMVGDVLTSGSISLSAGNLTIANRSKGSTEVTVTPNGGYNGRLVWPLAVTGTSSANLTGCYSIASLPVDNISTTTLTMGIGAACNCSYQLRIEVVEEATFQAGKPVFLYAMAGCLLPKPVVCSNACASCRTLDPFSGILFPEIAVPAVLDSLAHTAPNLRSLVLVEEAGWPPMQFLIDSFGDKLYQTRKTMPALTRSRFCWLPAALGSCVRK
jgi:hypothetical protein